MLFLLFAGIIALLISVMLLGLTRKPVTPRLDYRHNGDHRLDSVTEYNLASRTDRWSHHAEGDAYKQDKHNHVNY